MKAPQTRRLTMKQLEAQVLLMTRKVQAQRRRALALGITQAQLDEARTAARAEAEQQLADGTDVYTLGGEQHKIIGSDEESVTFLKVD